MKGKIINIIKENKISFIFLIIVLFISLHIFLISFLDNKSPDTIFIYVQTSEGTPDVSAFCKADIFKEGNLFYRDKSLEKVEKISDYIDIKKWSLGEEKGYYLLYTGLNDYKGNFEIKIVCIGGEGKSVGYTIINNTNVPCEIKNKRMLIC